MSRSRSRAVDLSEQAIIDIRTQREQCCHVGGSLAFDPRNLLAVGDNTNPFRQSQPKPRNGYAPIDEREDRMGRESSAMLMICASAILRVKPKPTAVTPPCNLFKPGTKGTRPEIFVWARAIHFGWESIKERLRVLGRCRLDAGIRLRFDEINSAHGGLLRRGAKLIANSITPPTRPRRRMT